jgi:putative Mn2+ efflux pump MntP
LEIHRDVLALGKALAVAFAVGLDVLAISVGVGVARLPFDASLRLGIAFADSEIAMQAIGYALGVGAGQLLGDVATYLGFALLAFIGFVILRKSFRPSTEKMLDATRGMGLLLTSLSISLDSLGVGIALPAAAIPIAPLLILVSITTTVFTFHRIGIWRAPWRTVRARCRARCGYHARCVGSTIRTRAAPLNVCRNRIGRTESAMRPPEEASGLASGEDALSLATPPASLRELSLTRCIRRRCPLSPSRVQVT